MSHDSANVILRLLDAYAVFEPPYCHQINRAILQFLRCEYERHGHLEDVTIGNARLENTDYGIRLTVNSHRVPNQFGVRAKMAPELMGEDNDMVFSFLILARKKVSSEEERAAKRMKIVRRDPHTKHAFRLIDVGDAECSAGEGAEFLECPAEFSPLDEGLWRGVNAIGVGS